MGLPDDLATQREWEIPLQLQRKLQEALGHCQPHCVQCALVMHRHRQIMELRAQPLTDLTKG